MILIVFTAVLLAAFSLIWWRHRRDYTRLLATVTVITIPDFQSHYLGNKRSLTIFLPPTYHQSSHIYSTLYVNDGQDKEALKLQETLARLFNRNRIEPIVVIAIPTNDERLHEYGTAVAPNAQGLGTKAGLYAHFVTKELMPYIHSNFRVKTEAAHTAVLGASLGGLSAFDLAWNHPDKFGIVGVLSGSFWWRAAAEETNITPHHRIAHSLVRRGPQQGNIRFWFEAATQDEFDDRDNDGVIDAIQDTLELMAELEKQGYKRGQTITYVEVPGGRHNYNTWAQVLPQFLEWAFPI